MKKRFLTFILTIATMLMCVFGFSACKKVEFKINFVVEGNIYATVSTSGNEVISMPENPTKDDYTFDGWYWDENTWKKPFTANSLSDTPLSSDMKVYAKFNKNHIHEYTPTTTEPTCTEKGLITYTCSCGDSYTEDIPATGEHTWDDGKITTEPTCTEKGVKTFTCTVCKTATYTEDVEALKHDEKTHQAQAPTCTEIGWEEYVTCEREGCEYSTYKEIPATGVHTWDKGEETKAPTCTKEGEMTYTCTVCKTATKTEPIDKLPHEHAEKWSSNATYHWHECSCGDKADEEQHTAGAPATATTPQTCTVCGYVLQVETGILFNTLTVNGTNVYGKVSNDTEIFSFINEITVKGDATYVVDVNISCKDPIESKTVELSVGDNKFYVLEKIGNNVKLFMVTIRRRPMYEVTFDVNGGTTVDRQTIEEDSVATEPETTKMGYTLVGWNYDFTQPITQETHITAIWEANQDTKYTTNYYKQNINNADYTLSETIELKGVTNTTVTAVVKNYDHFTYNEEKSTIEGIIYPDGSLVLSVYYTRNNYTIQAGYEIVDRDTAITQTETIPYGVECTCEATSIDGYTFLGWYDEFGLVSENLSFAFIAEKNVTYIQRWKANDNTRYTVVYYLQNIDNDDYMIYKTEELEGSTDTTATADVKTFSHFTYNASKSVISGNIDGNGKLVLSVYYTRDSYKIIANNNNEKAGESTKVNGNYRYDKQITLTATTNAGYTFLGWFDGVTRVCETENFNFKAEKDVTYTAKWSANTDTKYTVNYYLQNLNDNNYTLYESKELKGETNTTATAEIKKYSHFTYNESESTISGNIDGNGNLVLNVYYTRDSYTIATAVNNTKAGTVTNGNTYRFDKQITLTATTNAGYTFLGWFDGVTRVCETENFNFKAEKDVTYTAKWSANTDTKYTVNYYLQNLNDNNYTLYESKELKGETNTTATADVKTFPHFTYNASKSVNSGNINGNGNCQLNVYYTRDSYTIATQTNNEKAGTISGAGTYKYDKEITLTATTKAGYTFLGWYDGETLISETANLTFKAEKDVTYTAKWRVHTDTPYTVEYYFAKIEGGYTVETFGLTGETDTTATAEIKEYSHFTYRASGSTTSGNIAGNGSLVLRVYYTRNQYDVATDTNNTKGGTYTQLSTTYYYDFELTLTATTNVGYTWLGWYEGETRVSETENFTFKVEKDVTYTAKWQANTTTKYKVNYYLQNVDSDTYTLQESVGLTGTTDTLATAEIKTYTHFVYNASKSTTSGNINGNGGQILKVYYTRVNYTVTTSRNNTKGGAVTGGGSYNYDKQITLTATTNAGYTFLGWYEGETPVCTTSSFTLNVQKNVTYTAKWQANSNTKYSVNYYLQNVDNNNYTLYETVESTGTTDTTATATIKEYTHFTYKASSSTISGTIKGDGSLVLNVYYTRNSYTVTTEGNNQKAGSVTRGGTYRYDKQITLTATTNAGYTFLGWFESDVCVCATEIFALAIDKTATYTAKWQANGDTVYTVNYYLQNIDNDNYTVYETEELSGTTDTTVNAEIKTYNHFTYKANASTISGNLAGNGSLVLNVYYTRDTYTIAIEVNNAKAGTVTGNGTYLFDKQITLTATTNAGYTFLGWYEGETFINDATSLTFTVENDVSYTAKWFTHTDTKYIVNYYWQNIDDDYTLHETVELTGATDTNATAEIKEYQHFTYNESRSKISGNINGNGTLVLSVYYTRDNYTIAIDVNNTKAGKVTGDGTYPFDKQVTLTATTNAGYTFFGWYDGETFVNDTTTLTFTVENDVFYTAKWLTNTDTKYIVNYYWQNIDDDYYTLHETVELIGITDTETIAEIKEYEHFTFNENESAIIGNINGDDSLVLWVYYTRNIYSLSINNSKGGVITKTGNYKYGKEIETNATPYLGYDFLGWYYNEEIISVETDYTFVIDKNITANFEMKEEMSNFNFTSNTSSCSITGIKDKIVTKIIVPDYVTSISQGAFSGCSSLQSITIPFVGAMAGKTSSDTYQYPFGYIFGTSSYTGGTETKQYYYGSSISSTTYSTYYIPTSLKKVTVTGGNLLYGAFYNCSGLTSVVIPDSVTSIGYGAFSGCRGLTSVNYTGTIDDWAQIEFGDSSANPLYYVRSLKINGEVVTEVNLTTATKISSYAFYNCDSLTSVVIGDSVTSIGSSAFYDCRKLVEVVNKSSHITVSKGSYSNGYVGYYALSVSNCDNNYVSKLTNDNGYIIYTDGAEKVLVDYNGTETDLVLPADITQINPYAFGDCSSLTSVVIGDSVTSIGSYAFEYCSSLTSVVIGDSITSIGDYAFYYCRSLTSVVIGDSVTTIGDCAFYNCSSLTSVTIGDSVTSIGSYAFEYCSSLTSVVIPDSVTTIGRGAFEYCSSLTSVVIPDSVTTIGSSAFYDCDSLTSVYYKGTASEWSKISMGSNNNSLFATRYYYSETAPALNADETAYDGNYWHYDTDGITPVIWVYTKSEE